MSETGDSSKDEEVDVDANRKQSGQARVLDASLDGPGRDRQRRRAGDRVVMIRKKGFVKKGEGRKGEREKRRREKVKMKGCECNC